jgi:DNA repair protein RadD
MIQLESILLRLGDRISDFFERAQFDLLKAMDADMSKQRELVKMALQLHTPHGILRNKEYRNLLLRRLERDEAQSLADILGIKSDKHPAIEIMKQTFRKNSNHEELLFGFFKLLPPEQPTVQVKSSMLSIQPKHGLYSHQRNALDEASEILDTSGRVMLHMPTGAGKTRTAMNLIAKFLNSNSGKIVFWLAHSEELCEQALGEFVETWSHVGDRPLPVKRFFGEHQWENFDEGLIIVGLSKLWNFLKKDQTSLHFLAPKIGLIVFDEAHQSIASTFKLPVDIILARNSECKLLGLTATPGRTWNDIDEDEKLAEMYNKQKVSLSVEGYSTPIEYLVEEHYLSNPEFHELEYAGGDSLTQKERDNLESGLDISQGVLKTMSVDGLRNAQILNKAIDLMKKGHKRILIFTINVQHAETLSSILGFLGFDSACITSKTDPVLRENAIKRFKENTNNPRILCNYGVLTTGFDAPKTTAAIIARPTTSLVLFSQMVGRVIRGPKVKGTNEAEIWTIVDTNLPGFDSLVGAFTNWDDAW